jgi:hypothetical protein
MIRQATDDARLNDAVQGPRGGVFSRLEPLCMAATGGTGRHVIERRRQGRCAAAPAVRADARIACP